MSMDLFLLELATPYPVPRDLDGVGARTRGAKVYLHIDGDVMMINLNFTVVCQVHR
jgi:hypothetical protein